MFQLLWEKWPVNKTTGEWIFFHQYLEIGWSCHQGNNKYHFRLFGINTVNTVISMVTRQLHVFCDIYSVFLLTLITIERYKAVLHVQFLFGKQSGALILSICVFNVCFKKPQKLFFGQNRWKNKGISLLISCKIKQIRQQQFLTYNSKQKVSTTNCGYSTSFCNKRKLHWKNYFILF